METLGAPARTIRFYYPAQTLPVSVTGNWCELQCAHCGGHYLCSMKPLQEIGAGGCPAVRSFLISGGCTADGKVPVAAHAAALAALKGDRRYNFHVGLVAEAELDLIAALADKVSFDFVGDNATIREVFGLARTVEDYEACYVKLKKRCAVAPHICIGLHGGQIRGEYQALERLKALGADSLTLIVFMPTRGTQFACCPPPALEAVTAVLARARRLFADVPVQLGCMRPGGAYRRALDLEAVRLGLDGIVNPAPEAVRLAMKQGMAIERGEECCVL